MYSLGDYLYCGKSNRILSVRIADVTIGVSTTLKSRKSKAILKVVHSKVESRSFVGVARPLDESRPFESRKY
jgi:uncharacterized protein YqfA (UPF0365 family)